MKLRLNRLPSLLMAVVIGASTFGLVGLPDALAKKVKAPTCKAKKPATMCYQGSTVTEVPPAMQTIYLNNHGCCGKCDPMSGT